VIAMDRTTFNANLKPLERRGLLFVSVDDADRRSRRPALTQPGRALLVKALPVEAYPSGDREPSRPDPIRRRYEPICASYRKLLSPIAPALGWAFRYSIVT
jgi:DNA-binding MarR family transcriptional regulator